MAASSDPISPRVRPLHTAVVIESSHGSCSSNLAKRTDATNRAQPPMIAETSEGKKIDSARVVSSSQSNEEITQRISTYEKSSEYLKNLTPEKLSDLLAEAKRLSSGVNGEVMTVKVNGTRYFIKKIPLTEIEKENPNSTLNLFNLPTYYQYRVRSAGFGVWREIAAHEITTRWVLKGECHNFPLMYHHRVLPRTTQQTTPIQQTKEETEVPANAWIPGYVESWGGSKEVGVRIEAIQEALADVIVFMEHLPQTLGKWLEIESTKDKGELAEAKITKLEVELNRVAAFMKSKGFLHLDAHCSNVMTKGDQVYFADFGLALSREFDLSLDEIAFFEKHSDFDSYFVAYALVQQLVEEAIIAHHGKEGSEDILRAYFTSENQAIPLSPGVSAIVERYRPICVLLDKFFHELRHDTSKSTPYPAKELAIQWAKLTPPIAEDKKTIDPQESVNEVCIKLEENYIFPDVAAECSAYLRQKLEQGAYDAINDPEAFAQALTEDLRSISKDKHIEVASTTSQSLKRSETEQEQFAYLESMTHGLGTYENLLSLGYVNKIPEQFGYLEVHGFQDIHQDDDTFKQFPNAVEASKKAMDQAVDGLRMKNPQSVIIDLRNNNGGSPHAVQRLCSYFLRENVPLNTIEWRKENGREIEEFNTLFYDEISLEKRMLDVPVYILTSQNTFSAGEEFANDMKALGRATIIGEVTKGGANPGRVHQLNEAFKIFIPDGESVNPHDRSNWEGTGVTPDFIMSASEALDYSLSLR